MAIKTFSTGNILTASDTNTYLNNGGLVYITEVSISGTATTLSILGCFSATYDHYRILGSNFRSSGGGNIWFRMLAGSTPDTGANYSYAYNGFSTLGVLLNGNNFGQTTGLIGLTNSSSNTASAFCYDIFNPFLARQTPFLGVTENLNAGLNGYEFRSGGAINDASTSFTGIQIGASSGNLTGVFRIYGYRQA